MRSNGTDSNGCGPLEVGDLVRLKLPENLRLHGAEATVAQLEPWGAHVLCDAAGSGRFRALWSEMVRPSVPLLQETLVLAVSLEQYTGSVCPNCLGSRMVRTGTCATCQECGTTEGCS